MKQGDIYFADLGPARGKEQQGMRPVLIISASEFNAITKLPIVLPITNGGAFARKIRFAVALAGSGARTTGWVRCDQPRTADLAQRRAKFVEKAPPYVVAEVLARVETIFTADASIFIQ